ncbi:hypothetical protein [Rubidibacter lacunae]|nr:hypothetical protein [Rubidibacter lacunae]
MPVTLKVLAFFSAWVLLWLPCVLPFAIAWQWLPGQFLPARRKLTLLAML